MIDYVRPPLAIRDFLDDDDNVIPYGERWAHLGQDGPEETYSVTKHPERFQPLTEVARALVEHLVAMYDVQREDPDDQTVVIRPCRSDAAQLKFVFDSAPMVDITVGGSQCSAVW